MVVLIKVPFNHPEFFYWLLTDSEFNCSAHCFEIQKFWWKLVSNKTTGIRILIIGYIRQVGWLVYFEQGLE